MQKKSKHRIAIFFTILFMLVISAPAIILSIDATIDVSIFYSMNEEEEENDHLKLTFKGDTIEDSETIFTPIIDVYFNIYTFKAYSKPHINLISPPPKFI
jgi:hypothetical protein